MKAAGVRMCMHCLLPLGLIWAVLIEDLVVSCTSGQLSLSELEWAAVPN